MILSVVVLHREMPRFAAAETIFGGGSPVAFQVRETCPIATIGHEWASVPFDLDRNDVQHFDIGAMDGMAEYTAQHQHVLLILRTQGDVDILEKMLPEGTHLAKVADRGPAKVMMATTNLRNEVRIGSNPAAGAQDVR